MAAGSSSDHGRNETLASVVAMTQSRAMFSVLRPSRFGVYARIRPHDRETHRSTRWHAFARPVAVVMSWTAADTKRELHHLMDSSLNR